MSYNGEIAFGLLGDYDALPDIDLIAEGIEASLAELLTAARTKGSKHRPRLAASNGAGERPATKSPAEPEPALQPDGNRAPTPLLPSAHGRPKRGPAADMRAKRTRGARAPRKRPEP
jgi:hypothetical protein